MAQGQGAPQLNGKLTLYVLLAVCGTLLSGWGWWTTTSILTAADERATVSAEWSTWRGGVDQKLDGIQRHQQLASQQLEEIKLYLRSRGWKQAP